MGVYNDEERAASNFANDLAGALPAEQLVLQVFSRLNKTCWYTPSEGYEPRGDMYCSHCQEWVEVKFDKLYGRTGNLFVELDTLKHSQAKYMAFVVEEYETVGDIRKPSGKLSPFIYVMDFNQLRNACRKLYASGKLPIAGGEFKKMQGYPLPLKTLQKADWCITIHAKASREPIAELMQRKYNKLHGGTTDFRAYQPTNQRRGNYPQRSSWQRRKYA